MKPKITIILPVFNAEKYLRQSIESVLSQTETDFELLILCDGCTDKSLNIAKSYMLDGRIKVISWETNMGNSSKVINYGLKGYIESEYITWISADDFLADKNVLQKLVLFLDKNPDIEMVSGNYRIVNIAGEQIKEVIYDEKIVTYEMMKQFNYICPSFLIRKSSIDKVGFMNENLVGVADWDFWIRTTRVCKVYKIPDVLYCWRSHGQNTQERNPVQYGKEIEWVRATYL